MVKKEKNFRMKEIWLEVDKSEKEFKLGVDDKTKQRWLMVKGDLYLFENIYSYRNYSRTTIRIKLTNARKVD